MDSFTGLVLSTSGKESMRHGGPNIQFNLQMTQTVKWLLITNVAIWFGGQVLLEGLLFKRDVFSNTLSLIPEQVLFSGYIWQLFTYMFLHTSQVTHILFNMLMLWFFGSELEMKWGRRFFITYYLVAGVGAAVIYVIGNALAAAYLGASITGMMIPVLGASGAIFGLLLAYGMIFGERVIYFMMMFPMKAKYFVMIMGFVEFASLIQTREKGAEVAYLAHLGGLVAGYLFLKGRIFWQNRPWSSGSAQKRRGRNLRLVVDNQKEDDNKGPRYWN